MLKQVMVIKKNIFYHIKFWAGLLLAQFLLFFASTKIPIVVLFFENWFEFQKKIHQEIFAWIPFSFGDVMYILLGIYIFLLIFKLLKKKTRKITILKMMILMNCLYFVYQIFWGMLYFQTPLLEKLPKEEPTLLEAKNLALLYLEKCKQTRALVQEDKNGVFNIENINSLKSEILEQQKNLPKNINNKKPVLIKSIKPSLYKQIMSFTGIFGYYNPFTAEAQYNGYLPSSYLPFTMSHESAHQMGYAREQEANFIGYLIGKNSSNVALKYSTELFVLKSLLNSIGSQDENFVNHILENYSEPMKRDRNFEKKFMEKHKNWLQIVFGYTNNLFLKSNQQDGSISYSYFVDLLLRYEKNHVK